MLIAQITDLHLGYDPDNPAEFNRQRLDTVLHRLMTMRPKPDAILATGDLTEFGDDASFRRLVNAFEQVDMPVLPCPGNHDLRAGFAKYFPDVPLVDGFVQYVRALGPLRVIVTDTLEEGRHGGAFCERRVAWLNARLDEDCLRPTLLVLHHPPVAVGIEWMDTDPDALWVARLRGCIEGRGNIIALVCGHVHRAIVCRWAGTMLVVCPSTAPQVALDLAPMNPEIPDGRAMIVADPPAYALHWWNGRELVTHFDTAMPHTMLAKFDAGLQPMVRSLVAERP